jgi:hypothetical protein
LPVADPEAVCPPARTAPFVKPSLVLGVAADPGVPQIQAAYTTLPLTGP